MTFNFVTESDFSQQVLGSTKPVLVHFWAPWCKLCRRVEPTLIKFYQESGGAVELVTVNADKSLQLTNTYNLKILPTLLVFEKGELIYRFEGFPGQEQLYRKLTQIQYSQLPVVA